MIVFMDMISSIVVISCPSSRTCSENLDLPSAYLKYLLCSLNLVLKFGQDQNVYKSSHIDEFQNRHTARHSLQHFTRTTHVLSGRLLNQS